MSKKEKELSILHPNAAGIDIGASVHYACVTEGRDTELVKRFECFTPDLYAMAQWFKKCGVDTVAMEATGVYWLRHEVADESCFHRKVENHLSRQVINRAAVAFSIAAHIVGRTQTTLGAFCRRIKQRSGAPKAITATARKIACLFYRMLKYKQSYVEVGIDKYEKEYQDRI